MDSNFSGPTSHIYFSQRLRLHYLDWGNEEAPILLLIHGGRDHCRNWDWVAQALRNRYHIITPDLRGHGDSQWVTGSSYRMIDYVYDLAQLVHQKQLYPINIVGHSLGGSVSLEYAGLYPKKVRRIIAIEGLGPPVSSVDKRQNQPLVHRISDWIEMVRELASRSPRHYASIDDAVNRLQEANPRLSPAQAYHLTIHGTNQKEDGTYVWKFDNYVRTTSPYQFDSEDATQLWKLITCPTLLISGAESWSGDPEKDERASHFQNAQVLRIQNAGHWVHHDQLTTVVNEIQKFLA